ncbi:MAG TPA: hypothetical protein VE986_00625, partial [Hyphomicrobiales bacterium]|nr:hypothetical protein [Hyphomicrobiales bacterium]
RPAKGRQTAWWDELNQLDRGYNEVKFVQVYEPASDMYPTGLLDAHGNELFRIEKKAPIGFKWSSES